MEDLIKVKCPFCGSLLQFKKRVDFICPVCKSKSLVADCQNSLGKKDKEKTVIEDKNPNSATGDASKKIEVARLTNGCCKHILQNWQNKNPTYISGEQLMADDRIILQNGMIIKFANIEVKFIIKDSEETNL